MIQRRVCRRSIIGAGWICIFLRSLEQARTEVCCYQLTAKGVRLKIVYLLYCKKGFRTAYIQHMYKCDALQAISSVN